MKSVIFYAALVAGVVWVIWWVWKHPPPLPEPPTPELVAVAQDGTKLWRVYDKAEWVYFSTSGASWETRRVIDGHGNTRTIHHQTPASK